MNIVLHLKLNWNIILHVGYFNETITVPGALKKKITVDKNG